MQSIVQLFRQLLFPTADSARPFSMLGLGDIVIPGKVFGAQSCIGLSIVCCFADILEKTML